MSTDITTTVNFQDTLDASGVFTTVKGTDIEAKKTVFSAVNDAEPLSDHLGETLDVVDIVAHKVEVANEESGEIGEATRVVLLTADGKALASVSVGIQGAVRNILAFLGEPSTWDGAVKLIPVERKGRRGFRYMSLMLAKDK